MKYIFYTIRGIVQGVGFRPFIYKIAIKNNIVGRVYNDVYGVKIEAVGTIKNLTNFESEIISKKPPRANILDIQKKEKKLKKFYKFEIVQSYKRGLPSTLIPPDTSFCKKCQNDLIKNKRRMNYSFTNCLDCGPRFTITYKIPFDRCNTTMQKFQMCPDCLNEYEKPDNRRFHSQTNCCSKCGPKLLIKNRNGIIIKFENDYEKIEFLAKKILENKIVAIKGIGGFHLAANPFDDLTVQTLRKKKIRDEKPLALMALDVKTIKKYALVSKHQQNILESFEAPITILQKKNSKLSKDIFSSLNTVGFMLPYTPIHYMLMKIVKIPLIMTSGNISNEPIISDNNEALKKLKKIADFFLLNDRDIYLNCDDSVINCVNDNDIIIRRSRGYVPTPLFVNNPLKKKILALGAEEKNTFAIVKNEDLIVSHHIGDVENYDTYNSLLSNINKYKKIYDINPVIIAVDKHPEYLVNKITQFKTPNIFYVQHHYAHKLSLVADRNLDYNEKFLSFIWDGTGYGDDGNIWGGEILYGNTLEYKRVAHLEYTPFLTPDKSIKEPEYLASDYLFYYFNNIPDVFNIDKNVIKRTQYLLEENKYIFNSSIGRLFDVISFLTEIKNYVSYTGQLAVELENAAQTETKDYFNYEIELSDDIYIIKIKPILEDFIQDITDKKSKSYIATKFHNTLYQIINTLIKKLNKKYEFNKVGFSGGVFQNQLLCKLIQKIRLKELIFHKNLPPNDAGISAGQTIAAISQPLIPWSET